MSTLPFHFADEVKADGGLGYSALAAGAGDNVEVTGGNIDRMAPGEQGFDALAILHCGTAVLGDAETLTLRTQIQESADGSAFDAAEEIEAATVVATGGGGGTTETYQRKVKVDLRGRKRFVRILTTPNLSAGATDTADGGSVGAMGGAKVEPV